MPDDTEALRAEVARLGKVVQVLMDRAERSTNLQETEFGQFQFSVMLADQVRARTSELETALRDNERLYRDLHESEARYRALVDQSLVGIAIIDEGRFGYVNPRFEEIFGYTSRELAALGPLDLTCEADCPQVREQLRRRWAGEVDRVHYQLRGLRKGGELIDLEVHGSATELAGKRMLVSVINDVTERCRAEAEVLALQEELRQQSMHDPLTGLYNRRYLMDVLGGELQAAARQQRPVSLVMSDLDHFKQVNDSHGHQAGDEVLKTFASVLLHGVRSSDIGCRLGGEEFLLVLPGMAKPGAMGLAERLCLATAKAHTEFQGRSVRVTASFGVATFPDDGQTVEQIMAAADQALYAAKKAGRNRVAGCPAAAAALPSDPGV